MEIYGTDDYIREMEERKMITGNKLERYLERCEGERKPITAEVFLSDRCNLRCSYCRYGHESGKTMDSGTSWFTSRDWWKWALKA